MEKKVTIELLVEAEDPGDRVEDDVVAALSECLRHFDVVKYTEEPQPTPQWEIYAGGWGETYFKCPICGHVSFHQLEACPSCHTQLEP